MNRARLRWLVLPALLSACAAAPTAPHAHFHSATVTTQGDRLLPGPDVTIPTFGTVVWQNANADAGGPIEVEVARAFEPSEPCSTTLNFVAVGDAARSLSVPPQGIAALCFHHAGTFDYVVRTGGQELRGTVRVGGGR